jgi:hypothetical protein
VSGEGFTLKIVVNGLLEACDLLKEV